MYQKNCKSDALVTFMCAHKLKRKRREKKKGNRGIRAREKNIRNLYANDIYNAAWTKSHQIRFYVTFIF